MGHNNSKEKSNPHSEHDPIDEERGDGAELFGNQGVSILNINSLDSQSRNPHVDVGPSQPQNPSRLSPAPESAEPLSSPLPVNQKVCTPLSSNTIIPKCYFSCDVTSYVSLDNYVTSYSSSKYFGRLNNELLAKITEIVKKPISQTNVDHFALEKQLDGHLLTYTSVACMKLLIDSRSEKELNDLGVRMDFVALENFLMQVEELYFPLPFHNKTRAAIRVHAAFSKLQRFPDRMFPLLDEMAIIIVGSIRDIRHPGFDNHYQISSQSSTSYLYNFDLPIENYACYKAFELQRENQSCNFMKFMTPRAKRHLREKIVYLMTEGMRKDLFSLSNQLRALMESKSRSQFLELPSTHSHVFFPFLLQMADQVHYWGLYQLGHSYWLTQEMKELVHQSDSEAKHCLPRTTPSRNSFRQSFDDFIFYVNQRFAYVDDGVYLLHNYFTMVLAHSIMQQNVYWWNFQTNENTPEFRNFVDDVDPNYDRWQNIVNNEVQRRRFPPLMTYTTQNKYLNFSPFKGNEKFLAEVLEYVTKNLDSNGELRIRDGTKVVPFIAKDFETALQVTQELSEEERKSGILYHTTKIYSLDFDIFSLTALLGDSPLVFLGSVIMESRGLIDYYKIPRTKLVKFLYRIQTSYYLNPYHNAIHAGCVLQASNYILRKTLDSYTHIPKFYYLALFIAAAAHDVDHPGFNNSFQKNSNSYLSTLYNDRSAIENHSAANCIALLRDPEYSFLENLDPDIRAFTFHVIAAAILATDMEKHVLLMKRFQNFVPNFQDDSHLVFMITMILKLADLINSFRPLRIYREWAYRICHEFIQQGDYEKFFGLEVGPLNDRDKLNIDRSQHFFLLRVVKPFMDVFHYQFPNTSQLSRSLAENIRHLENTVNEGKQLPSRKAIAAEKPKSPVPREQDASFGL